MIFQDQEQRAAEEYAAYKEARGHNFETSLEAFGAGTSWRGQNGPERKALEVAMRDLKEIASFEDRDSCPTTAAWCAMDCLAEIDRILGEK